MGEYGSTKIDVKKEREREQAIEKRKRRMDREIKRRTREKEIEQEIAKHDKEMEHELTDERKKMKKVWGYAKAMGQEDTRITEISIKKNVRCETHISHEWKDTYWAPKICCSLHMDREYYDNFIELGGLRGYKNLRRPAEMAVFIQKV